MKVVMFEDEATSRFAPISSMRHIALLNFGSSTLLGSALDRMKVGDTISLAGRGHLAESTTERTGLEFNAAPKEEVELVNGRILPSAWRLRRKLRGGVRAVVSHGEVVMLRVKSDEYIRLTEDGAIPQRKLLKLARGASVESPEKCTFSYPWDLVELNSEAIIDGAPAKRPDGPSGAWLTKGDESLLNISASARVDSTVTFDTRLGPILVGDDVDVDGSSYLAGPCSIGAGTVVHSARIGGGTTIGQNCRVGGEVDASIISSFTNKAHYGYVGHSLVGEWVNLGAGSVFSDLKNTYGNVRVSYPGEIVDSGLMKLGPVIGDMCKVSVGCMVFAGKRVGASSHTVGLVAENVPSFVIYMGKGDAVELTLESAVETQRRMMQRRGKKLSHAMEALMRTTFRQTAGERSASHARRGLVSF